MAFRVSANEFGWSFRRSLHTIYLIFRRKISPFSTQTAEQKTKQIAKDTRKHHLAAVCSRHRDRHCFHSIFVFIFDIIITYRHFYFVVDRTWRQFYCVFCHLSDKAVETCTHFDHCNWQFIQFFTDRMHIHLPIVSHKLNLHA